MEKRINIICNYSSLYAGNFIPSILNLCEKLTFSYIVLSFPVESKNRSWIDFIKSKGYPVFFYENKHFKKDISSINRENHINVVYSHFISGLKIKNALLFYRRIKLFIHIHSDFSGNNKLSLSRKIKKIIEKKLVRTDASYIFVSKPLYSKDKSKNKYYVHNALCLDRIFTKEINYESFLEKYHINKDDTVFLLFGWSPYVKGVDLAVKAFLSLPNNLQNKAKFMIVYGKDDGKKKCIEFLIEQLRDKTFLDNHNLVFVPPQEDVFSLYTISDVYVMSSRSEGFSYSLLESLYFDLKCLVNDIEGCAWAKQIDNCLFFKTNSIDELSQLIKNNIGVKSEHNKNPNILKEFDINEWSKEIKSILEK